jgi:[CysO sulfur-carrier protein]-S-L-cysteine hydrolase
MTLQVPGQLAKMMVEFCKGERPNEACGILAAADGEIVDWLPMTNAAQSPVRYALDPQEQFLAYRRLDDQGWELGAVFHSHTRSAAYPSPTDVRLAFEDVPYVIVSLAQEPADIRAFRIIKENWADEHGEIVEIPVAVQG